METTYSTVLSRKENEVNILKSIDEGPFQMGTFRETLDEGDEGALHLGQERPRVYSDLLPEEKERYNTDIRATNILLQGLPKDIYTLINHCTDANDIWDNVKMLLEDDSETMQGKQVQLVIAQNNVGNTNQGQARQIKCYNCNGAFYYRWTNNVDDDVDEKPVQDLALNVDNVFQAVECDAFDSDVDEASTTQTVFMENLSSADHVYDEASSSYDSDILSEGRLNRGQGNNPRGGGAAGFGREQNRVGNANPDKMLLMQAQENGMALDEDQLLFLADNYDAFDSDVDEAPMARTMFMANLSSADHVYDEAGLSYDSDILSEKQLTPEQIFWSKNLIKMKAEALKEQTPSLRPIKALTVYPLNTPATLVPKYVKDNAESDVQNTVSSVPHDAPLIISNEMHEPTAHEDISAARQKLMLLVLLSNSAAEKNNDVKTSKDC
nr:integrase, catalytic region, zinc finger, CCHC-type, peptidase aspartic, catalytic [Tanacetum cinerariifolium]